MTLLRPPTALDAGRVGAILSGWTDETDWMPRIHSRAEDIAHAGTMVDRGWVTVAETEGRIAGFMARDGAEIHALYVDAPARGSGVGARLLADAMTREDRLRLWTFEANIRARTFYERHGFDRIDHTDGAGNDEGLPDIRYLWQRTAA